MLIFWLVERLGQNLKKRRHEDFINRYPGQKNFYHFKALDSLLQLAFLGVLTIPKSVQDGKNDFGFRLDFGLDFLKFFVSHFILMMDKNFLTEHFYNSQTIQALVFVIFSRLKQSSNETCRGLVPLQLYNLYDKGVKDS